MTIASTAYLLDSQRAKQEARIGMSSDPSGADEAIEIAPCDQPEFPCGHHSEKLSA